MIERITNSSKQNDDSEGPLTRSREVNNTRLYQTNEIIRVNLDALSVDSGVKVYEIEAQHVLIKVRAQSHQIAERMHGTHRTFD